ncbi:MAG: hypothetical protein FWC40_06505 [Proteobacteria bacterium]|nr:hypothetical protein [Pseudomonadota bacterium]
MKSRLITAASCCFAALALPVSVWAQGVSDASDVVLEEANSSTVASNADDEAGEKADKRWKVGATAGFDLGLGAFVSHEYARRVRSRFTMSVNGSYKIPVIDVTVSASTGFSQWMSKAGGSNGIYEFRWSDSDLSLSRKIWGYKSGDFAFNLAGGLGFTLPTSKASLQSDLYTSIVPSLSASVSLAKFSLSYSIAYSHSFHKYTSMTLNPSDVDVLSRSTGIELIGSNAIAIDGVLTEIALANQFVFGYSFLDNLALSVGLGFMDAWSYDNGTITKDDEYVSENAKVGRGHKQYSMGTVTLSYLPIEYLTLSLSMVSMQPWKTADNKTLRFPWFDTVSPAKNYTTFLFTASFKY